MSLFVKYKFRNFEPATDVLGDVIVALAGVLDVRPVMRLPTGTQYFGEQVTSWEAVVGWKRVAP